MVEVIMRRRSSSVLTPSSIPCLSSLPTINVSLGCALGCTYCYIQGYPNYPGRDRIVVYENTAELVSVELARKRRKPTRVYFSPSCDAYQPVDQVQDVSFDVMSVLLDADIEVAFLTKGYVTDRFLTLFAAKPHLIHAQIGITTLDASLALQFEPRAAKPVERISTIATLSNMSVDVSARLDPLIPGVTDTDDSASGLFEALAGAGVATAAASYLFLRPGFAGNVLGQLDRLGAVCPAPRDWSMHRFIDGCGAGRMIDRRQRHERFARLRLLGKQRSIDVITCRCKNPDLGGPGCRIAGADQAPRSKTLPTSLDTQAATLFDV